MKPYHVCVQAESIYDIFLSCGFEKDRIWFTCVEGKLLAFAMSDWIDLTIYFWFDQVLEGDIWKIKSFEIDGHWTGYDESFIFDDTFKLNTGDIEFIKGKLYFL